MPTPGGSNTRGERTPVFRSDQMKINRKTRMLVNEQNEEKTRNTGKNSAEAEYAAMNAEPIGTDADTADSESGSELSDGNEGAEKAPVSDYEQAAMLLGCEMLDRIGIPEGINPIAVAIALLDSMGPDAENSNISIQENDSPYEGQIMNEPTANSGRLPMPMRGSIGKAQETDYSDMSREEFMKLRKQLQKANMDGRRVRI